MVIVLGANYVVVKVYAGVLQRRQQAVHALVRGRESASTRLVRYVAGVLRMGYHGCIKFPHTVMRAHGTPATDRRPQCDVLLGVLD